jgi:outer membrane protein assembly factor BamB
MSRAGWRILLLWIIPWCVANAADWSTFRGNMQRTGSTDEIVGLPEKKPAWVRSFDGCAFVSSPSVASGVLYVGSHDSCVYAMDANSGQTIWRSKTGGWVESTPTVTGQTVVVGSFDGSVYILDRASGAVLSRVLTDGIQISSPGVLANGAMVSGWGYPNQGAFGVRPALAKSSSVGPSWTVPFIQTSYSSPAIMGQLAVIGANDGRLYGLDAVEGRVQWTAETQGGVYLSTPAIDGNSVYFAPGDGDPRVYAVDIRNGKPAWTWDDAAGGADDEVSDVNERALRMRGLLRLGPHGFAKALGDAHAHGLLKGVAADSWMWVGDMHTSSVAVDRASVYVIQKLFGARQSVAGPAAGLQYVPRFQLVALDKGTGAEKWRFSELRNCFNVGYCSSPAVTRNAVYFGWGGGMAFGVDKSTGSVAWRDTLNGDIIASPAVSNGRLYFATMTGSIYCFKLSQTMAGIDFQTSTYCYPNPARGDFSTIQVYVNQDAHLSFVIYTMADQPVLRHEQDIPGGEKTPYQWDIRSVANGVYFARVTVKYAGGGKESKVLKIAVVH